MQMMESTAHDELGMDDIVSRAEDNIHAGAKYLRYLVDKYLNEPAIPEREKVLMTLAAYNAGPGNLKRFRDRARQDVRSERLVWKRRARRGGHRRPGNRSICRQYLQVLHGLFIPAGERGKLKTRPTPSRGKLNLLEHGKIPASEKLPGLGKP